MQLAIFSTSRNIRSPAGAECAGLAINAAGENADVIESYCIQCSLGVTGLEGNARLAKIGLNCEQKLRLALVQLILTSNTARSRRAWSVSGDRACVER